MKLMVKAAVLSKKITLIATAFVLAVSTLTASVPFILAKNASAATTVTSQAQLVSALEGTDTVIELGTSFSTTSQVNISRSVTINGNGHVITPTFSGVSNNDTALAVVAGSVTLNNLTIEGVGASNVQGIQVWQSVATLNNITSRNNDKAGIHVNGSTVTITNATTSGNGGNFGGIMVSGGTATISGQSRHTENTNWTGNKMDVYRTGGAIVDTNEQYGTVFNVAGYVIRTLKVAPLAPTITTPAAASNWTTSTVTASWGAVSYAATYDLDLDGTVTSGLAGTSRNITGLSEGSHTIKLRAVAKSGLQGPWSAARTFMVDLNDVPEVTVATPAQGSVVSTKLSADLNKLQIKGTFTDDEAINYLQFELVKAGNLITVGTMHYFSVNPDGTYTYKLEVPTNLITGEYSLFFTGTDFEGGVTTRFERVFTVDNTKPVVELLSPVTADPFQANGATVSVKATDNIGVSKIVANIYKDGTLYKSTQAAAAGLPEAIHTVNLSTIVPGGLPSGNYSVRYNALDIAGNLSSTANFMFVIDNEGPDAPVSLGWTTTSGAAVTNGGATKEVGGTASWSASPSSDVSHYIYRYWNDIPGNIYKEASPWVNPSSVYGQSYEGAFNQGEGIHYFSVAAVDTAGNQGPWSAAFKITYDATKPLVEILTAARTLITGTASPDASVVVTINGADSVPFAPEADGTWSYSISPALTVGVHSITATARDSAGNSLTAEPVELIVPAVIPLQTPTLNTSNEGQGGSDSVTQAFVGPATISPVAQQDVLGDTSTNSDDEESAGAKSVAEALAAVTNNTDGNALGLAWYWWILIIAGGAAGIWWLVAALRGRSAE